MKTDLYTKGYEIAYQDDEQSLERNKILHVNDIEDTIHIVKQGEDLTKIAFEYYNDPLLWFLIADINNIFEPIEIEVGQQLIIPNKLKYNV